MSAKEPCAGLLTKLALKRQRRRRDPNFRPKYQGKIRVRKGALRLDNRGLDPSYLVRRDEDKSLLFRRTLLVLETRRFEFARSSCQADSQRWRGIDHDLGMHDCRGA